MNREIKFRFWNTKTKMMYADTGLTSLGLNDAIELATQSNYILMQFTGAKDKNGKEIYEGDVLLRSMNNKGIQVGSKHQVVFEHGSFRVIFPHISYTIEDVQTKDRFEVIGNIYQNPELI